MRSENGYFIISLDFELFWGLRDCVNLAQYQENILGVRKAIPLLLEIFVKYRIHATWAVVGFLFARNKKELYHFSPVKKPSYTDINLCPYRYLKENIGEDESVDNLHYGSSLIQQITNYQHQEIASHTFSHYYTLAEGQTPDEFRQDIKSAISIAKTYNINLKTIVFPRNQYNPLHISICSEEGFNTFRGNENMWAYNQNGKKKENVINRVIRLIDSYINLTGHHIFMPKKSQDLLCDISSSRFLRPYFPRLGFLELLRLRRITKAMTIAAKKNKVFHLWWHPHNFGRHISENFSFLEKILKHYELLQRKYRFQSLNMQELSNLQNK